VPPGCQRTPDGFSDADRKESALRFLLLGASPPPQGHPLKRRFAYALGGYAPCRGATPRLPAHTGGEGRSGIGRSYPWSCDEGERPMLIINQDTVWSRVREPA
jgi:hypothetical protein